MSEVVGQQRMFAPGAKALPIEARHAAMFQSIDTRKATPSALSLMAFPPVHETL